MDSSEIERSFLKTGQSGCWIAQERFESESYLTHRSGLAGAYALKD